MGEELFSPNTEKPIYNNIHIQLATFIGGPVAIVYILAENFKQLGFPDKVKKTWIIGMSAILLFGILAAFIRSKWNIPSLVFPLIFLSVGAAVMQGLQGKNIKLHVETGGPLYSYGRAVAVGLACLVAILALLMIIVLVASKGQLPK